ncbi:FliM/FliN family flagellar motor switch protein [Microbulbifer rhizosphaerae]|uniref:Flagellar motor switch/type III secretory pathway protein FliN n=1 Tax=Microbulbifer rhizosphaerae TaxID=1562603 RepID=A0A7W4WFY2_9GAMM|nr:FliM/FliN family flagellar motor C-terminal domain-containing protein [Microbulbifer rhizosphaerae]MBB3063499.1 flagellar motor switch/type III secretory pathway protein FliN [Microbulbifer rhizosphaerae]
MSAFPFYVFSDAEIEELNAKILDLAQDWSKKWFGKTDLDTSICNAFRSGRLGKGEFAQIVSGTGIAFCLSEQSCAGLVSESFKTQISYVELSHPIFQQFIIEFLKDFLKILEIEEEVNFDRQLPEEIAHYGSGWLEIKVLINGDFEVLTYLSEHIISSVFFVPREFFSNKTKLAPIDVGIRDKEINLLANLGRTFLDLNQLCNIKVGDVIRLDTEANQAIEVCTVDGQPLLLGDICEKNGNNAVLVRSASTNE